MLPSGIETPNRGDAALRILKDAAGQLGRVMLLCLGSIFLIAGCGREEAPVSKPLQSSYEGTIVAMGDSLTEGLGVAEEQAYPAQLQEKLLDAGYNYKVVNAGISGETSSGARSRVSWVLTLEPDILILETGANDGLRGLDPQLVRDNIRYMVETFRDRDIIVILAGMQIVTNLGPEYTQAFAAVYPLIARESDVILIPFFLEGVAGRPGLNQPDGIHPTAEGYGVLTAHILPHVINAIDRDRMQKGN